MVRKMNRAWMLAVLLPVAGCVDNSYRGRENIYASYEIPQAIKVALGDPYVKGTGPVDSLFNLKDKDIFVWAFNRDTVDVDYRITAREDNLICLLDSCRATLDGYSSVAEWVRIGKNNVRLDTAYYYPGGEFCNRHYDFYCLYPDDATLLSEHRGFDNLVREYMIDGSQDIMVSKAQLPVDKITKEPSQLAFSYLSVLRGEDPYFTMNHVLTRMDLFVRPGVTTAEHTVRVQAAELRSRTHVSVTPVAKDQSQMGAVFTQEDDYDFLSLTESDGTAFKPYTLETLVPDLSQPQDERLSVHEMQDTVAYHRLGGSFFVSPEKFYKLRADIRTLDVPDGDKPTEVASDVQLKDDDATFLPGCRYIIYMTVYGEIDISIRVVMVPWYFAGSIYLDPDADTEIDIFTDADTRLDQEGFLVLPEGTSFQLNARNHAGVEMSFTSSDPDVADVVDGVLVAGELPEGVQEATARITIRALPTHKRPEGGYKVLKVKVTKNNV